MLRWVFWCTLVLIAAMVVIMTQIDPFDRTSLLGASLGGVFGLLLRVLPMLMGLFYLLLLTLMITSFRRSGPVPCEHCGAEIAPGPLLCPRCRPGPVPLRRAASAELARQASTQTADLSRPVSPAQKPVPSRKSHVALGLLIIFAVLSMFGFLAAVLLVNVAFSPVQGASYQVVVPISILGTIVAATILFVVIHRVQLRRMGSESYILGSAQGRRCEG